jgi:hypothetical protein
MAENIDYGAIAQKLIDQVTAMKAEVPFLADRPRADLRRLTSAATVPDEFIENLAVVIAASAKLTSAIHDDVNGMRDQRRYAVAFAVLENQLRAFAESIRATMVALRHESGRRALAAYATVQAQQRQPGGQDLAGQVDNLSTILGRGRTRKAKAPATTPAPNPNPTT